MGISRNDKNGVRKNFWMGGLMEEPILIECAECDILLQIQLDLELNHQELLLVKQEQHEQIIEYLDHNLIFLGALGGILALTLLNGLLHYFFEKRH